MERDSFVFYRSWLKSIQRLSIERQNGMIRLAVDYGLDGITPSEDDLDPMSEMFLNLIMPQVDANNKKFLNGCNGGAPKGNRNNPNGRGGKRTNQETTKNKPISNQEQTENQRNVYDNVNVNENVDIKKENNTKKKIQPMTEEELAFHNGMIEKYPNVMKLKEPLCLEQYRKLVSEFGKETIVSKLEAMENYKPLLQNNNSANRTIRNWIRLDNAKK